MGWDGMGVRFIVISLLVAVMVDTVAFSLFFLKHKLPSVTWNLSLEG